MIRWHVHRKQRQLQTNTYQVSGHGGSASTAVLLVHHTVLCLHGQSDLPHIEFNVCQLTFDQREGAATRVSLFCGEKHDEESSADSIPIRPVDVAVWTRAVD